MLRRRAPHDKPHDFGWARKGQGSGGPDGGWCYCQVPRMAVPVGGSHSNSNLHAFRTLAGACNAPSLSRTALSRHTVRLLITPSIILRTSRRPHAGGTAHLPCSTGQVYWGLVISQQSLRIWSKQTSRTQSITTVMPFLFQWVHARGQSLTTPRRSAAGHRPPASHFAVSQCLCTNLCACREPVP